MIPRWSRRRQSLLQKGRTMSKQSKAFLVIGLVIIAVVSSLAAYLHTPTTRIITLNVTTVSIGNSTYSVFLASTGQQQTRGLMNYTFSSTNSIVGELFINLPSYPCFWMKNTPEPLIQAWIENGSVVYLYNATPESDYVVCHNGSEVLELKKGITIAIGDRIATS